MTTDTTELALVAKIKKQLKNFDNVVLKEAEALALVEALELKEEQRANWFQMAQKMGEDLDAAEKRISELEESNAQVIQSRDHYKRMAGEGLKQLRNQPLGGSQQGRA